MGGHGTRWQAHDLRPREGPAVCPPPRAFQYTFAMGQNDKASRATIELVPETEARKVTVTHDEWAEDDATYAACADGWPRILSRLKTLLETGRHSGRINTRLEWSEVFARHYAPS